MENLSLSRLVFGVGVIVIGIAALLGAFGIINFSELFGTYWPVLLIVAGLVLIADNPKQNYLWGILLFALGAVALFNTLDIVEVNFWQLFWPLILIVFGWSVLTQRARINSNSADNVTAILGGAENKNQSQDYRGGKVTAIMGGCSIDLAKADIKKEATLEILAVMGGIELRVPENWEVRTSVMPILGGAENKTIRPSAKTKAPVLNVVGTALLGGIEIKN